MAFKGLCCRQRGAILNSWPFYSVVVETKCVTFGVPETRLITLFQLANARRMWLLAQCGFSPRAPILPKVQFKALQCGQLSWCAMDGRVHLAICCRESLHITTMLPNSTSIRPCCLLRWRTILKGEQGVWVNWPVTFLPEAQPFRYNIIKHDFTSFCFLSSSIWFELLHPIHLHPPIEGESCHLWQRHIFLVVCMFTGESSVCCLMLHCFECLDKVEKMLMWHTCHWY